MSDWDDYLFYEAEREDNDGVPIEGDPFNDPEDSTDEEGRDDVSERTRPAEVSQMVKYLFIDTETNGLPYDFDEPAENTGNWPRMVQCGYILAREDRTVIEQGSMVIRPDGFIIPEKASRIHGITTGYAMEHGVDIDSVLEKISQLCSEADAIVGHNISFDEHIIDAEFCRAGRAPCIRNKKEICTMIESTEYCGLPNGKWPKLCELHEILFGHGFEGAHDAMADIKATFRCFWKLADLHVIPLEGKARRERNAAEKRRSDALRELKEEPAFKDLCYLIIGILIALLLVWVVEG